MATVSLVLTTFQLASTAFAVTLNAAPAVWADGVPVLPVAVPGAAVSPGANNCNLANAPAFTVIAGLVELVLLPSVLSAAVTVQLPAVLFVRAEVPLPEERDAADGRDAKGSVVVMLTGSPTVFTRFQFASTALTVTL